MRSIIESLLRNMPLIACRTPERRTNSERQRMCQCKWKREGEEENVKRIKWKLSSIFASFFAQKLQIAALKNVFLDNQTT